MDLETCKEVYLDVAQKVFQSDKTIGGLPYKKTLFKASLLEECLKDLVRKYDTQEPADMSDTTSIRPGMSARRRGAGGSTGYASSDCLSSDGSNGGGSQSSYDNKDGNALLFDSRPERCKT